MALIELSQVTKYYEMGNQVVRALDGIDIRMQIAHAHTTFGQISGEIFGRMLIVGAEDLPSPQRNTLAFNHRSAPSQPSNHGHLKYFLVGQHR